MIKNTLKKILRVCKKRLAALRAYIHKYYISPVSFHYVGENWERPECASLPVAVFFGFNNWKQEDAANFFTQYRCAFVMKGKRFFFVKRNLRYFPADQKFVFVSWSRKITRKAKKYAHTKDIPVLYVEDGFIRSMDVRKKHTKALSYTWDTRVMYFDYSEPSDLEEMIVARDFGKWTTADAEAAIEIARAMKLTKYYDLFDQDDPKAIDLAKEQEKRLAGEGMLPAAYYRGKKKYSILVMGQVEDDASITYGSKDKTTNVGALERARKDYPDAEIYYRPHPDVYYGNRAQKSKLEKLGKSVSIVDQDVPLHDVMQAVDHVYTITSLTGFEALLYGKKVTCLGAPFYSNWGFTDDKQKLRRRRKTGERSYAEVFAAAYLHYSHYVHPDSDERIDFFELASYFFVEKVRSIKPWEMNDNYADLTVLKKHIDRLSAPAKLFFYLRDSGDFCQGKPQEIMNLVQGDKFRLHDFRQFSHLLMETSNFDALKEYCDDSITFVERNSLTLNNKLNENVIFFQNFIIARYRFKGRALRSVADFSNYYLECKDAKILSEKARNFLQVYLNALLINLDYEVAEKIIYGFIIKNKDAFSLSEWQKFTSIVSTNPARKERDHVRRTKLLVDISAEYQKALNQEYKEKIDFFINLTLKAMACDDEAAMKTFAKNILDMRPLINDVLRREKDLLNITSFLISCTSALAEEFLALLTEFLGEKRTQKLKESYYLKFHKYTEYFQIYDTSVPSINYATVLQSMGNLSAALTILKKTRKETANNKQKEILNAAIESVKFLTVFNRIVNSHPQPKFPKGVIFLAGHRCFNTLAMLAPALREVRRLGYAVISLTEGILEDSETGVSAIDKFSGQIRHDFRSSAIQNTWEINWKKHRVFCEGINYYQGLYEVLSNHTRDYFVDLKSKSVQTYFMARLSVCDAYVTVMRDIFRELVQDRRMPVVILSGNTHAAPYSIARDFCMAQNHPLLSFVNVNVAYESYFTNLGSKFSTSMCFTDMTMYPNRRAPFLAEAGKFEKWYQEHKHDRDAIDKATGFITMNRNQSQDNSQELALIEWLNAHKAAGKKIICAIGKTPVDLAVPYDGGPAHEDMADWLNHTIETCGAGDDVVLLVKPHPHELRPEIAMDLVHLLFDLIKVEVAPNVRLLGHKEINMHALAPHIDLAVMYNGSSAPELTVMGVPVLMAAHFGRHDYPLPLIYPESREQYERFLLSGHYPKPLPETRDRAALLIGYMGSSEIAVKNTYSLRPITNDSIGTPKWNKEKVEEYLRHGDPEMERAAREIVAKFAS
ncbi:MAG: hypothetical protein ABW189_08010 [Rickettsiales bacterium]